jgi:hypothetical protein
LRNGKEKGMVKGISRKGRNGIRKKRNTFI